MTTEELLRPRYKVTADYFHNPYKVGDIITLPENNRSVHLTTIQYNDEFGEQVRVQQHYAPKVIEQYPHLFQPLEWWEDRKPEDMPEYARNVADGVVYKLIHEIERPVDKVKTKNDFCDWFWHSLHDLLPATEEEYIQYKNQNK